MKILFSIVWKMIEKKYSRGFILPFTMLISVLVLIVMGSVMTLLSKQLYFSKIYKQSQTAYYAADDAIACAIEIDDTYVGSDGLGIFPNSTTTDPVEYIDNVFLYINAKRLDAGLTVIDDINDIQCAQSSIFDPAISNFSISPTNYEYYSATSGIEEGKTSMYTMRMPLGDGSYRCAKITINKTASFRQVIAQGYAKAVQGSGSCDIPNGSVERAVVNTTASEE